MAVEDHLALMALPALVEHMAVVAVAITVRVGSALYVLSGALADPSLIMLLIFK
jgi:hypothetical protein